jgi:serine/threonine protein kinase
VLKFFVSCFNEFRFHDCARSKRHVGTQLSPHLAASHLLNKKSIKMSSGELPLEEYHRAQSIGSGSFGSIVTVYNDDGEEFAMKLFIDDDDDDDCYGMSLGALREVSILRMLRVKNAHPNIIAIHDIQPSYGEDDESPGILAMAMPLFREGSLGDCFSKFTSKKQKVVIAHGILSAVAFLHENAIIHRDIKSDNILLKISEEDDSLYCPVLIDFSLAKATHPEVIISGRSATDSSVMESEPTHTPSMGTPTYRAPEVVDEEPYSFPADLWSVGVVLMELLRGSMLEAVKDKGATHLIAQYLEELPKEQPFPELIRGLLQVDPSERWTARRALQCDLFQKYGLASNEIVDSSNTFHHISLSEALPLVDIDEADSDAVLDMGKENNSNATIKQRMVSKTKKKRINPVLSKRFKKIQKICEWMGWENPMTVQAAMAYSIQMADLVDDNAVDNVSGLLDCITLAHKFFEQHLCCTSDIERLYAHFSNSQAEWDPDTYAENEGTLFMMMDFCLYPRKIVDYSAV